MRLLAGLRFCNLLPMVSKGGGRLEPLPLPPISAPRFRLAALLLRLAFAVALLNTICLQGVGADLPPAIAAKVKNVPMSTEHGLELYQHWVDQALSSLFSAVANKRLKTEHKHVANEFGACSKEATTVVLHARCVSKLLKNEFNGKDFEDYVDERLSKPSRLELYSTKVVKNMMNDRQQKQRQIEAQQKFSRGDRYQYNAQGRRVSHGGAHDGVVVEGQHARHQHLLTQRQQLHQRKQLLTDKMRDWVGGFRVESTGSRFDKSARKPEQIVRRARRDLFDNEKANSVPVVSRDQYALKSAHGGMTPFGGVARLLLKSVLSLKNKTEAKPWQHVVKGVRETQKRRKQMRKHLEEDSLENMEQFAFRGLQKQGLVGEDLDRIIEDPKKLKKFLTKKRKETEKDPMTRVMNILREGMKIGYSLSGKNASEMDDKTMKVASPRFLSVVPEDDDNNSTIGILSPSLFSLHNDGKGLENLTSLPNLVQGFSNKDQQEWMNLIIEAAGVDEHMSKIDEELRDEKNITGVSVSNRERYEKLSRTKDGTPLYFTKENLTHFGDAAIQKVNVFEQLERTYTKEQIKELSENGYAMLTKQQLYDIYGPHSPYRDPSALHRFMNLDRASYDGALLRDISATTKTEGLVIRRRSRRRQRDITAAPIVLSPVVLAPQLASQPIVLSPIILSPLILSPAVLGPVILSPWVFVPVILSPRVLSPLILSPFVLSPIILSPLVLHPVILSPGVLSPLVLSPGVLSPVILSPFVFVPIILGPLVLSPLILSPAVGSPLVLSPFVLSPIILSPQILSALVLSPYAASPIILTPLVAFSVVLSPSWLS